ncbi:MAG: COX15/CtaA family protein [Saprospiraceae bacterium]|nr:COX15/CtaA family protein [Saprospiraceae bacterium]
MTGKNLKPVIIWLYLGVFLIVLMVLVGGAVRLTDSGLSIVKWDPITGIIPPLNESEWQKEFNDYKNIPEFQIENKNFSLSDFKKIYLWEYFHRLIARLIGFIFLIPFLFFWIKGYLNQKKLLLKTIVIFLLASFQAWLGWYMVKSGFSGRNDVSHYRLAIHLVSATLLASYVLWLALSLTFEKKDIPPDRGFAKWTVASLIILSFQLVYGAFTAGLNAGYYYTQYPKMGGEWIPSMSIKAFNEYGFVSLISDPGMVHFIHRWFAIVVLIFVTIFYFRFRKTVNKSLIGLLLKLTLYTVLLQVLLGIFTVLTKINIVIALLHQVNGILIFLCFVSLLFFSFNTKK